MLLFSGDWVGFPYSGHTIIYLFLLNQIMLGWQTRKRKNRKKSLRKSTVRWMRSLIMSSQQRKLIHRFVHTVDFVVEVTVGDIDCFL